MSFVDKPLSRMRGGPSKSRFLSSAKDGSTAVQPQPAGSSGTDDQSEKNQEENVDSTNQAQEETPGRKGGKRGAGSDETIEGSLTKKICLNQMTPETYTPSSESSDFVPAAVTLQQVETVSLRSLSLPDKSPPKDSNAEELNSREDEMTDVKEAEVLGPEQEKPLLSHDNGEEWTGKCEEDEDIDVIGGSGPHPVVIRWTLSSEGEEEDGDEDIDVIGGSGPVPRPVVIRWTLSSEGEEEDGDEDIDVVGEIFSKTEKMKCSPISSCQNQL